MGLREALGEALAARTTISAIVGTKIYEGVAPPGTAASYLTYSVLAREAVHLFSGPDSTSPTGLQIDAWARDPQARESLAQAVRDFMGTWRTHSDRHGVVVGPGVFKRMDQDLVAPSDDGIGLPWFRNVQRWEVWSRRA